MATTTRQRRRVVLLLLLSCLSLYFVTAESYLPIPGGHPNTFSSSKRLASLRALPTHDHNSPTLPIPTSGEANTATSSLIRRLGNLGHSLSGSRQESQEMVLHTTKSLHARGGSDGGLQKMWQKGKVLVFILLWYYFNVVFNISNKRFLNAFPLPWAVSVAQLGIGSLYAGLLWLFQVRPVPRGIGSDTGKLLLVLSIFHALSHITAITALGAGAVSFTHIVKSAEPFFSSLFAALIARQFFPPLVYLALVPVVGGVAYASVTELTFSWTAFLGAMASNVICAARGVVVKGMMGSNETSKEVNITNTYAILTIAACLMLIPFCILFEHSLITPTWQAGAAALPGGSQQLARLMVESSIYFYLYNEVAFLALESLHPISHAVTNTIKRVVVIVFSVLAFRNPVSIQSVIGSSVAIVGVFLYSLAKYYCTDSKKIKKARGA